MFIRLLTPIIIESERKDPSIAIFYSLVNPDSVLCSFLNISYGVPGMSVTIINTNIRTKPARTNKIIPSGISALQGVKSVNRKIKSPIFEEGDESVGLE